MRRKVLFFSITGFSVLLLSGFALRSALTGQDAGDKGSKKPAENPLPIKHVVLFNSGVGYFQREGEITGNARLELSFPTSEINDLLKSLILQDTKGKISTVNYDSHDPIDKILRSFALDLNSNPSFGQILNQARGEKIEVLLKDKKDTAKLTGTIVGMEVQQKINDKGQAMEVELLNLTTTTGLQSLPLTSVLAVRFLNPTLESEFQRALKVLARSHDTQKKSVSVGFTGQGKRPVKVGYVVERPIWKTTYRLRLDPKGKLFLQGWALVENTSDDDWNEVRMVLVSGRPISYKMDLYEPLYIPRPTVEPELFASLRPPVYSGTMSEEMAKEMAEKGQGQWGLGNIGQIQQPSPFTGFLGGGMNNLGGAPGPQLGNIGQPPSPPIQGYMGGGNLGWGFSQFGNLGGMPMMGGGMPMMGGMGMGGGQLGGQVGRFGGGMNRYQGNPDNSGFFLNTQQRLTYEELQRRRQEQKEMAQKAKKAGSAIAGLNFKEGITSVASAEEVGDYFQYILDQKISLPRQKSAMVPILDQTIEGAKVSIFNEAVQAKYPLLGLRLKNTSGQPLTQGPITVYEEGAYAGDTRILDVQPNESRLLSYALDQSMEIKTQDKITQSPEITAKIGQDGLTSTYKIQETKTYAIKNRSRYERKLVIEHPIRGDWNLITPAKPVERTRDHYRFEVLVPPGKLVNYPVVEEQARTEQIALTAPSKASPPPYLRYLLGPGLEIQPVTKTILGERMELKILKNVLHARHKVREVKTYFVTNNSGQNRVVQIDHLVRSNWTLVGKDAGDGKSPKVVRFTLPVDAGKVASHEVVEERLRVDQLPLTIQEEQPARYVLGLGVEVQPVTNTTPEKLTDLKIVKGQVKARSRVTETRTYFVKNNAEKDRVFLVEHLIRPGWNRLDGKGDVQRGPGIFRFELKVAAGKTANQDIIEERTIVAAPWALSKGFAAADIQKLLADPVPSVELKAALSKMLKMSGKLAEDQNRLADLGKQLKAISDDQARLRANLTIIPQNAEPYKEFLQKFVTQERAIENLQGQVRQLQASVQKQEKEYEAYISGLNAE